MSELKCLESIIGLSKTECPCFDDNKPSDADVSKSGYYVDELQGLNLKLIGSDLECGEDNVWLKMENAVESAKTIFKTDFLMSITHEAKAKKSFTGRIGEFKSRKSLITTNPYVGLRLKGNNMKGSQFTLNDITTLMDADATFNLLVFNNIQEDPLIDIENLNAVANKSTPNPLTPNESLTFPLYSEECDYLEYYFLYVPDGFEPRDNKVHCGCSRKQSWEHWVDLQGVSGDDELTDIDNRESYMTNGYANGLILNLTINCNTQDLICGGENEDLDYINDPIARVIAASIHYKAGEILVNDILSSNSINRYTLLNREALYGKRNHYAAEYGSRIHYLGENVDITSNDCLSCDDDRIRRSAILS